MNNHNLINTASLIFKVILMIANLSIGVCLVFISIHQNQNIPVQAMKTHIIFILNYETL